VCAQGEIYMHTKCAQVIISMCVCVPVCFSRCACLYVHVCVRLCVFPLVSALVRGSDVEFVVCSCVRCTQYTPEVGLDRAPAIRGIVIARRNRNLDSSFRIMNAVDDDIFTAQYPFNSPLLKGIKVLQKWRLHDGVRRSRRAKLYYLKVCLLAV
jgi:ribosomal protein L19